MHLTSSSARHPSPIAVHHLLHPSPRSFNSRAMPLIKKVQGLQFVVLILTVHCIRHHFVDLVPPHLVFRLINIDSASFQSVKASRSWRYRHMYLFFSRRFWTDGKEVTGGREGLMARRRFWILCRWRG
ncbi:hypothetical protein K469DRAFT_306412 [Zopfia rhizophila CBS 207.26]|uniref:Uncharacterized protein n=1 Tax=Zopfia rhizophila CBS 207.26 TaxID=1314779 RepID=A0A6A6EQF4_9PEZI|nr:hypothetical protein K469DRAFT_306412 [Zopfia rhizophila CBS 207.26]